MKGCSRRDVLRLGAAAAAAATWPLRAADAPSWGAIELDWTDSRRQREVPVRLYLPNAARPAAPVPLVVFSHGIGGSRRGYSYLGSHFAGHGMASLHVQHVGSDRQIWTGGNVLGVVGRLHDAAQEREAVARVHDWRFAVDTLLASEHAARIDARRIVAAGHSYGANTTLMASGARVPRAGGTIDLHDDRVRAAIVISAPPFYGEGEPGRIVGGIKVPSLHVTATEDIIRIPGYYSGVDDRVALFDATGGPRKWLAMFEGGSHSMFTDRGGTGGALLNPQVKAATQELVLAFVRSVFDGDEAPLAAWPQRHAAILARFTERSA
jgi:dienelactone hydrolase